MDRSCHGHRTLSDSEADFCERFHAGEPSVLGEVYDQHFETVERALSRLLSGPDRETVTQELFYRLLSSEPLRRNFRGGSFAAWIATVARNQAVDFLRKQRREVSLDEVDGAEAVDHRFGERAEANLLVERFRREVLPKKWERVFQARFLGQLSQREAAAELGMSRTTLVYQELRVHALLRRFLLDMEER
jgi:RNA polymerase sigma-70 factor (ECF subfamily)